MSNSLKRSTKFLLSFAALNLGLNYLWISYNSLILPEQVLRAFPPALRGIALGGIASGGVAIGVLINLFSGIISDGLHTRIGRRRPLIIAGTLLLLPVMFFVGFFPYISALVAVEYVLMQFASNLAQGSFQPLLPDLIPREQRGEAGGYLGLFLLIGNALGYGITGLLVGMEKLTLASVAVIPALLVTSAVTLYTIWNHDSGGKGVNIAGTIRGIFRPSESSPGFFWLVIGSFFVMIGSSGLMYFELYYFKYVLEIKNPAYGVGITGLVVLVVAMLAAVGLGKLSDRTGRKRILIYTSLAGGLSMAAIPFLKTFYTFLVAAAAVGATTGAFSSVETAFAGDLSPESETGQYMAYSNLAIGGSSAVAPVIDGLVIYLESGSIYAGFLVMFLLSAAFYFLGSGLLFRAPAD
ncbi:MAG: MFS transporter [Nitrososphaerota archaeon]|nr:MFS transporter [Nitrososphaerota archaeon]